MKRINLVVFTILLLVILPLVFNPDRIFSFEVAYVILFIVVLNYTQPELERGEAKSNRISDAGSVKYIILATALSIVIPLVDWAYFSQISSSSILLIGVILNIGGLIIRYISIRSLGRFFTATVSIKHNQELIRSGLYKHIRHPSYTGAFISILSLSLVLNSFVGFISSLLLLTMAYYYRIKREESELEKYFVDEYPQYKKDTWKMIPFVW